MRSLTVTDGWLDFPPSTYYIADMHGKEGDTLLMTYLSPHIKNAPTEAEVSQIFHLLMLEVIINPGAGFGHESGSNKTAVPQSADLSLMSSRLSPLSPGT